MAEEISSERVIKGIKSFVNNMPSVSNGSYVIQQSIIEGYGSGQIAYDALKIDFDALDFSEVFESSNLDKKIKKQQKQLDNLEKKHASLVAIFGEDGGGGNGTLTHTLLEQLQLEIVSLIEKRDDLLTAVKDAEHDSEVTFKKLKYKIEDAEAAADAQVKNAVATASGKVKLINQFSDFLSETNKNMNIYYWVIFFLSLGSIVTVAWSIPSLLKSFDSYDSYVNSLIGSKTPWQILNFAFGILIVKLPWALCLSAVFTGIYRLLKGLLTTYEKINQDKRNMSAIYAVSGNIAQSLNEYGLGVVEANTIEENGSVETILVRISNKDLNQKKESLKWNQIMNYFERMQNHKEEIIEKEDESKLKLVTDLLKTAMERIPKTQ